MGGNSQQLSSLFNHVLVIIFVLHKTSAHNTEFCKINLFQSNSTWLQFTKEVNTFDFVVRERSKSLSCCAKGYNKLEWFKDGDLISDGNDNVTFSDLKEQNQTVHSDLTIPDDSGNYTCVVYNETASINRTIMLRVLPDKKYMGPALLTFVSEEHQYAQIGESTRFFCEAYIGYGAINYSEVTWLLINEDNVTDFPKTEDGRRYVEQVQREKSVIIGEYLYFKSVHEEDYRTYICKIHKGDTPKLYNVTLIKGDNPLTKYVPTYKRTSLIIVVFTVFVVVSFFVYQKWKFELRLYWKDHFGKLEDDDKDYDVFVCYDQADADFALGVLVHTLEEVYTYKCFAYERDSIAGDWVPEIYSKKIRECRRFVMVLSPDLAVNSWCIYALYVAIEAMLNLHSKIICVVLQDIPWDRLEPTSETKDCTLQQVMRVVQKVYWKPPEKRRKYFSISRILNFQSKKLNTPNRCDSEDSLPCVVLDGSSENIIQEVRHSDSEQFYGPASFWTELRIHLPPKRHIEIGAQS